MITIKNMEIKTQIFTNSILSSQISLIWEYYNYMPLIHSVETIRESVRDINEFEIRFQVNNKIKEFYDISDNR